MSPLCEIRGGGLCNQVTVGDREEKIHWITLTVFDLNVAWSAYIYCRGAWEFSAAALEG